MPGIPLSRISSPPPYSAGASPAARSLTSSRRWRRIWRWHAPTGGNRVAATLGLLERLEGAGILTLTAKRVENSRPGPYKRIAPTPRSAPQPSIKARLPLCLHLVVPEQTGLGNEFVERQH